MTKLHPLVRGSVLSLLVFASACAGLPSGAHVRVATASAAELERVAAAGGRVYYEFEEGDRVPLVLAVAGLFEAETGPVEVFARRRFAVLLEPNGSMFFVLDGRHLTPAALAASWTMLFGPGPDGRAATGIVIGIGDPSDLR